MFSPHCFIKISLLNSVRLQNHRIFSLIDRKYELAQHKLIWKRNLWIPKSHAVHVTTSFSLALTSRARHREVVLSFRLTMTDYGPLATRERPGPSPPMNKEVFIVPTLVAFDLAVLVDEPPTSVNTALFNIFMGHIILNCFPQN